MASKFTPPTEKSIDDLLLDQKNPRIPAEMSSATQEELIVFVAEEYDSLAIAQSIASHEYFSSEPVIAIPDKSSGHFVVVEGNRRLAALKLLLHPDYRSRLSDRKEWDSIPLKNIPKKIPVVVAKNRKEVTPILGYRHISGIQQWDAYAKARYIAAQVDSGLSFKKAAGEVGEGEAEIRSNYRNYKIAQQVKELNIDPTTSVALLEEFGVFTRAMQAGNLRDFIGAPSPSEVTKGKNPIPTKKQDALKELAGFLFGPTSVLDDSRNLTKLGKVISSQEGLKSLRRDRNLEEAHVASGGLRDRLVTRLSTAGRNLRAAKDDLPKYKKDEEVIDLVQESREALDELGRLLK
jgi:hypothetical protein